MAAHKVRWALCLVVSFVHGIQTATSIDVKLTHTQNYGLEGSLLRTQGVAWTEDFESGGSNWRSESTSAYYTGPECFGGSGSCWRFTGCNSGGDMFSTISLPSECGVSPCTLTYEYKGRVLAGLDTDGIKGGSHTWYNYDSISLPSSPSWLTRTVTGITQTTWHLMFETYASTYCTSYLDNMVITTDAVVAAAVGDPHLQNVHGERFDLMQEGKHVLINIPRGETAGNALLRVQAEARRMGGHCADMYFQEVNVTGSWAEAKQVGGYQYNTSQHDVETPQWVAFGEVELKVVHGHTGSGLKYLNVYVKHLGRVGFAVGGLLGEDDHEDVITPPEWCGQKVSLKAGALSDRSPSLASLAVGSLA